VGGESQRARTAVVDAAWSSPHPPSPRTAPGGTLIRTLLAYAEPDLNANAAAGALVTDLLIAIRLTDRPTG